MLSIIIPAYNVERYIKECLQSVIPVTKQGHEVEIIVVNDGSTDGTLSVIEAFRASTSARMTIINQPNGGLSNARNSGLRAAKGRYVWFIDGDDRLLPDVTLPWKEMEDDQEFDVIGIEMVQSKENTDGKTTEAPKPYHRYIPPYGAVFCPARDFLPGINLMPCPVAYIVRREFLISEGLTFREGIYHEDEDFTLRLFLSASSFIATPCRIYDYILHPGTITTTTDLAKQEKRLRDILSIIRDIQHHPHIDCARYKLDYLAVDTLRLLLRQHHSKAFQREVVEALRTLHLFPLPWHWEWKYILFRLFTLLRFHSW